MPRTESLIDLAARVKNLRDTRLANDQCRQCGKAMSLDPSASTLHCGGCYEKVLMWSGYRKKPLPLTAELRQMANCHHAH